MTNTIGLPFAASNMFVCRSLLFLLALFSLVQCAQAIKKISVVGSINADTFLHIQRIPVEGENLTCDSEVSYCRLFHLSLLLRNLANNFIKPTVDLAGGKGCTQAIAASKLVHKDAIRVAFGCRFGDDTVAHALRQVLVDAHVDLAASTRARGLASGRGYVFLTASGQVSAVVSGGSNQYGWKDWKESWGTYQADSTAKLAVDDHIEKILGDECQCLMLQREIPEYVNELLAAKARERGNIVVLQDVGGEDRPMSSEHMQNCDYLVPNESELCRLVASLEGKSMTEVDTDDVTALAKQLQLRGARNVLVTQGSRGCTLVTADGDIVTQPAIRTDRVVDETGAGDCFRAGFAVALLEGKALDECLSFASAAGCLAVETQGAVPSAPTREAVMARIQIQHAVESLRGGSHEEESDFNFPFLIGSRLNSMKDRPELWQGRSLETPRDFVQRQATVKGLTCVDFNYPQHFGSYWTVTEAKAALDEAGLVAGAVCLRYPKEFARGAMNHPDPAMRRQAIEMTKQAAQVALELGCREVVVWSAYDGYDYPFQCDYDTKWRELVDAFRECCDAFPNIRFSVEYKPTDENTRFFTIPSTGAALLMVQHVDRPNFGLTLDVGQMLMSGENPGQSIAMVGKKLFGIQLNDGFTRLAAEDGLMFGSVHPSMALEIMYQLRKTDFDGHLYFDTFPQRSDPVKEAEYNIRRVKAFYRAAGSLLLENRDKLREVQSVHDAIGALELVDDALKNM